MGSSAKLERILLEVKVFSHIAGNEESTPMDPGKMVIMVETSHRQVPNRRIFFAAT